MPWPRTSSLSLCHLSFQACSCAAVPLSRGKGIAVSQMSRGFSYFDKEDTSSERGVLLLFFFSFFLLVLTLQWKRSCLFWSSYEPSNQSRFRPNNTHAHTHTHYTDICIIHVITSSLIHTLKQTFIVLFQTKYFTHSPTQTQYRHTCIFNHTLTLKLSYTHTDTPLTNPIPWPYFRLIFRSYQI